MSEAAAIASSKPGKATLWIGRVITVVVGGMLIMSGVMKLMGGEQLAEGFAHLGIPMSIAKPLAILELTVAVLYLIPQTAVLGAILVAGYLGGAICTHWRVGDPFITQAILGIVAWLGIYLREPRLRSILPLRRL